MQNKNTIQQTITQEETIENQLLTAIKNHDLYTVISLNLSKEFVEKQSGGQRQSFLHAAAYFSKNEAIINYFVVDLGVNINIQDNQGRTPFFVATENENWRNLLCLNYLGANVNLADHQNKTPLSIANSSYSENSKLMVECLLILCDADPERAYLDSSSKKKLMEIKNSAENKETKVEIYKKIVSTEIKSTKAFLAWTKSTGIRKNNFGNPIYSATSPTSSNVNSQEAPSSSFSPNALGSQN